MRGYFGDNAAEEGHGRKSLRGGAVSLVARGINAFVQIGSVLFLARLLSPADYGLVSMVTAITGFAPLVTDLGTRDAVVQRRHISEGEVSALFWITNGIGVALTVLIAASGPLIARFYGEPRLTMIAMVSSVTFLASALMCQHHALLRRAMRFKELGAIEVGANVLSAVVAIIMALYGFHYWALVFRPIAMACLLTAGVWWRCRWLPGRPTMTSGAKAMLALGLHSTGFTTTDFAGRSTGRVMVGYRSGATELGYYQNAMFVYENLLDVLVYPLHPVAVASLSKLRDNLLALRRSWTKAISTLAFYAMPAFGLLAVTSRDLIVLLLGDKWRNAGVLLGVLALRGMPHTIERTAGWLHVTAGRTDRWMRWGVFAVCLHIVALLLAMPFGTFGLVVAYTGTMFLLFVPAIAYAGHPLEIRATDVTKAVWRPMAGALGSVAVGVLLRDTLLADTPMLARTAALTAAYGACYLVAVVGLFKVRTPVGVVLSLVRDFLPTRYAHLARTPNFIDRPGYDHT